MKIKITSDGTPEGTKVFNQETGEPLEMVHSVKFEVATGVLATATVEVIGIPVELVGERK